MRRTGHRFQGEAVEKTALPPFEPPGRYLEQRKEALNLGVVRLSDPHCHAN